MIKKSIDYFKAHYMLFISIACILFIVIPYLVVAFFAGPSADDYSNLNITMLQKGSSFMSKALHASINVYKHWQGTYSGNIFTYIGGAIYQFGGMSALQFEYSIVVLLFFISSVFLFWRLAERLSSSIYLRIQITFFTTCLFGLMVMYDFDVCEVFYWHTGLSMYTLPLSFAILSIGLCAKNNMTATEILSAAILGLIASGGSLNISAFVTGTLLLIALYKSWYRGKLDKTFICVISSLIGAIINVIAPGNYIRHSNFSDSYPIAGALRCGFVNTFKAMWEYVGNGTILLVLCLCLILFNMLKEADIIFVNPVIMISLLFIGSVIIDFPVYLGYASGESFPSRCLFVRKVSMVIFILVSSINLTGWISKKENERFLCKKEYVAGLISLFLISSVSLFPQGCWDNIKPFKIWNDICDIESLKSYENTTEYIIDTLKNNSGNDVVINVPSYDTLGYFKPIGITSDQENWINHEVSFYFKNKSITFYVNGN